MPNVPPQSMYQSNPDGSLMVMPPMPMLMPPMSIYGTVNPMMNSGTMLGHNPMYGAYNTVNPAMYYNSINPMAYATANPQAFAVLNGQLANPFMQQQELPHSSSNNLQTQSLRTHRRLCRKILLLHPLLRFRKCSRNHNRPYNNSSCLRLLSLRRRLERTWLPTRVSYLYKRGNIARRSFGCTVIN